MDLSSYSLEDLLLAAIKRTLAYLATMEIGHYGLIEIEKDTLDKYEDYDTVWPMTHIGA
jgi:hypothetical protein